MNQLDYLQVCSKWAEAQPLLASRKAVLQKIVRHAKEASGTSFPGQRGIATATRASVSAP